MFSGILGPKVSILGTDMAGEVVKLGEGVDEVQVGDRVTGITPGAPGGAYAEYLCVDASAVVKIPPEVGYPEAAAAADARWTTREAPAAPTVGHAVVPFDSTE